MDIPTDFLQKNSADVISQFPNLASLFEKHKIEFCCQGDTPLIEQLSERGIDSQSFLTKVHDKLKDSKIAPLETKNIPVMIQTILDTFHQPLNSYFDQINQLTIKAVLHHGEKEKWINDFQSLFNILQDELKQHLWKEEQILFPMILQLDESFQKGEGKPALHCGSVKNPICQMEYEHEHAGDLMHQLDKIVDTHIHEDTSCNVLKGIKSEYKHFQEETHKHIHMENYVLHRAAKKLEEKF